jgi:Replication-relaxation
MTGSDRKGLVIQERDRHLLHELSLMRVADREQAKVVGGFRSTTRVNARLLALTEAGLLRRFFLGTTAGGAKALYALSEKGARLVGVSATGPRRPIDEAVVADFFIEHQLATNDVYCAAKYGPGMPNEVSFKRWLVFPKRALPGLGLIPDGYVEFDTKSGVVAAFIEVDLGHERLKVWQGKVRQYLDLALSGNFEREFHQNRFRVLVIAHSPKRLSSIRQTVAAATDKIFWFATLEEIRSEGLFASVWLRPKGDEPIPLIRETS